MNTMMTLSEQLARLAISPSGFTFDPQTGRSFTLNETGLAVLTGLRQGRSREELTRELARDYQVLPERVETSLDHFVAQLSRSLSC